MTIIAVALMCVAVARAEDEFVPQMECIDGIWYETFMPSKETVPSNHPGERKNCAEVLGVGAGEVFARVCRNEDEEIVPISSDLTIPSHVTIGGMEYEVIATGKYSLGKITNGATVTLPSTIKLIGSGSVWANHEYLNMGQVEFDEAYVKIPESIIAIESLCFFGLKSKHDVYLPKVSLLDVSSLGSLTVSKLTLGPKLTAMRDYCIPVVEELVFADGDEDATRWDAFGIEKGHTYLCPDAICSTNLKELRLPKWEKLELCDCFISYNKSLERIIFPEIKLITYGFGLTYKGIDTSIFYGYFIEECPNLREVVSLGETPPQMNVGSNYFNKGFYEGTSGEFEFMDNIDDCVLKVPAGSEELYRADPVWGKFKTIYGFENGDYTSIIMPEVAAPEAEAVPVYHNLQGMRVEHPVCGQLYIRTIGSRTDKVMY